MHPDARQVVLRLELDGSEIAWANVKTTHVHARVACCNQSRASSLGAGFLRETKPGFGLRQRGPGLTLEKAKWLLDTQRVDQSGG